MAADLRIFSGRAHPALGWEVCQHLQISPGKVEVFEFANENIFVRIQENVRGKDIFLLQPFASPVNTRIMEFLIMLDAFWRASPRRITGVIPYYAYGRSDKKDQPRVPITAKLLADLMQTAHMDRLLTLDLHADQIQGFFDIPVDHLIAAPVFTAYFRDHPEYLRNAVIVAPDMGGVRRARVLARRLNLPLAVIDKRRLGNEDRTEVTFVVGDVRGKRCIILDDEIDTGGSMVNAARALLEKGAKSVIAVATHAVFSRDAPRKLQHSPLEKVLVTNSLPIPPQKEFPKLEVLSIAPLLAEAIRSIHEESSITRLFRGFEP